MTHSIMRNKQTEIMHCKHSEKVTSNELITQSFTSSVYISDYIKQRANQHQQSAVLECASYFCSFGGNIL